METIMGKRKKEVERRDLYSLKQLTKETGNDRKKLLEWFKSLPEDTQKKLREAIELNDKYDDFIKDL